MDHYFNTREVIRVFANMLKTGDFELFEPKLQFLKHIATKNITFLLDIYKTTC